MTSYSDILDVVNNTPSVTRKKWLLCCALKQGKIAREDMN